MTRVEGPVFAPLVNMTPELDALMPPAGACWFCGGPDKRHRLIDAIRENARAGDDPWRTWGPPDYPDGMVEAVLALRPIRVQRSRRKGASMPWGARFVGRPTSWGNEFVVRRPSDAWFAVNHFRTRTVPRMLHEDPAWLDPLRDATALACWCPLDQVCHADVLLELLA